MRFLNTRRVLSNMQLAGRYLGGETSTDKSLKSAFIDAMNRAQRTTIHTVPRDIYVEFDNPGLVRYLIDRTVFSPASIADDLHLLAESDQLHVRTQIEAAKHLILKADPNLHRLIINLLGSIAAYHISGRDGGSVSCCIGLVWLSPSIHWTVEYYAEMIVHEFLHNSVFLEDMVRGVMPNPKLLECDAALTISVIRKTRRPYDKAFHSACVGAGLMYFYHSMGQESKAQSYLAPMRATIAELRDHDAQLRGKGSNLLTDNGRQILDELDGFVENSSYSTVRNALVFDSESNELLNCRASPTHEVNARANA